MFWSAVCSGWWRVRWRDPHIRGCRKLWAPFTVYQPIYSYSGGSPRLETTGKSLSRLHWARRPRTIRYMYPLFNSELDLRTICALLSAHCTIFIGLHLCGIFCGFFSGTRVPVCCDVTTRTSQWHPAFDQQLCLQRHLQHHPGAQVWAGWWRV